MVNVWHFPDLKRFLLVISLVNAYSISPNDETVCPLATHIDKRASEQGQALLASMTKEESERGTVNNVNGHGFLLQGQYTVSLGHGA
jgi:hypothetical protein